MIEAYNNLWARFGIATHKDIEFRRFQENWFYERFKLTKEEFNRIIRGKRVLEVGTGSGAFTHLLTEAEGVIGVDSSDWGIKIARRMMRNHKNIAFVKQDFMKAYPIGFDVVIADQCLHHFPDTFKGLKKAVSFTKKGGTIFFYVYKKKGFLREFCDDFLRVVTTRLPVRFCLQFSRLMCEMGHLLTKINIRLQRLIYWNIMKCFWNELFSYENNLRVNFDWYHPPIAHRHTLNEVWNWLTVLNLGVQFIEVSPSGISVRATR